MPASFRLPFRQLTPSFTMAVASSVLLAVAACSGTANPAAPTAAAAGSALPAAGIDAMKGSEKVQLCHRTGGGVRYVPMSVAGPAVDAHLAHGDARVGDPVVGQAHMVFAADCTAVPAAPTAAVLDQSSWGVPGQHRQAGAITGDNSVAQTFTVGISGALTRIDLGLFRSTATTASDVLLDILPAPSGLSTFDLSGSRASVVIPIGTIPVCPDFCSSAPSLTVSLPSSVAVSAGDSWAIVLRRPGGTTFPEWVLWSESYNPSGGVDYPGGTSYVHEPPIWIPFERDQRFQTYVAPATNAP